ncbi:hypothetical protein HK414_12045 [Ramlibacter terrae]|uniref:Phospholipase D-like domain-containing protein n=1 Tax=Ramlibacter terrae TaxID=2732511 RepID=A0ABX6P2E9_9BURK|nr:hypothetical protein HK414_12045 [Ramlibacter terrae]
MEVISLSQTDWMIAHGIKKLIDAVTNAKTQHTINRNQRLALKARLEGIVKSKLPDPQNIQHDGWKVLCMAWLELLGDANKANWAAHVTAASLVSNKSDRAYVLANVASCMPHRHRALAGQTYAMATAQLAALPSAIERMLLSVTLCNLPSDMIRGGAEPLLKQSLMDALAQPDEELRTRVQRDIFDAAGSIDEKIANRLAELIDDDPARAAARATAEEDIEKAKAVKDLVSSKLQDVSAVAEHLGVICWRAIGTLNAGKCAAAKPESMVSLIDTAALSSLRETFPVYLWYLRNLEVRYERSAEIARILRPHLEMLLVVADLAQRIADRLASKQHLIGAHLPPTSSFAVTPHTRQAAIERVVSWVVETSSNEVLLCDPYFGPSDLEILRDIHFRRPELRFVLLICPDSNDVSTGGALKELFKEGWGSICDSEPPRIKIIRVAFAGSHKGAIHDRWILSDAEGLRMGASLNHLGASKWSELSHMSAEEARVISNELHKFTNLQEWMSGGVAVEYDVAVL